MRAKIFYSLLIIGLLLPFSYVAAQFSYYEYQTARNELLSIQKGEKYLDTIDTLVNQTSETKRAQIKAKIDSIEERNIQLSEKNSIILEYISQLIAQIQAPSIDHSLIESITIDTNHFLAGQTLIFDVEIMKIDKADGNIADTIEIADSIELHYNGSLEDGEKFDSSYDRWETLPFTVGAGQMITGFDTGVVGMKLNEKKTLTLAPADAYGDIDPTKTAELSMEEAESFIEAWYQMSVWEVLSTQFGSFPIIEVRYK